MSGAPPVLILGWSSIARRRVAPALARLGAGAVDVASRTQDVDRPAGLGGRTFTDYGAALDASAATIVYVSTRNHEHAAHAAAALASGRHVVIDKPATLAEADTARLVERASAAGLLIAEATVWPWHPQVSAAQDLIAAHGRIEHISASFSYPPLPAGNFRHVAGHGGGALWDLGPYAVTPGRVFFDSAPDAVDAHASGLDAHASGAALETSFSTLMRHPGGATVSGHFSVSAPYVNRLELIGPNLRLTLDRVFTTPADAVTRITGEAAGKAIAIDAPAGDTFAAFLADVMSAAGAGHSDRFARAMLADARAMARLRQATGAARSGG